MLRPAAILLAVTLSSVAAAAPPDSLASRVDELITSYHIHGMPPSKRAKVRALGAEAIPILRSRLHDPAYRSHRTMICSVIGVLGVPEGFPILRSVVWDPGEVSNRVLGSPRDGSTEMVAQSAMARIAKRSDEALKYLQQGTNPAFWDSLPWYSMDSKYTRAQLARVSIIALASSERREARAFLVELSKSSRHEYIRSQARSAVARFDEIYEVGYDEYVSRSMRY